MISPTAGRPSPTKVDRPLRRQSNRAPAGQALPLVASTARGNACPTITSRERKDFDQGYSRCVTHAAHDGGVVARRQCAHDGRLSIVGRWNCRGDDFGLLIGSPVVVGLKRCPVAIVQLEEWIG